MEGAERTKHDHLPQGDTRLREAGIVRNLALQPARHTSGQLAEVVGEMSGVVGGSRARGGRGLLGAQARGGDVRFREAEDHGRVRWRERGVLAGSG